MHVLFGFGFAPGPMEMMIVLLIAVLLFGKRLPEVGRSLGKGLVEFKKGVRGLEDELESASSSSASSVKAPHEEVDDHDEATAPKFEPPSAEPQADSAAPTQAESPDEAKAETT